MPVYEYECRKCGHQFEIMQKITEDPVSKCPDCSGKVNRLISNSSFILKGSGWYLTDYGRKGSSAGGNGKDSGSESDNVEKKDKKEEKKPKEEQKSCSTNS